jgi:DHA1 family tetracycline resistance protein-like MFS transporter
MKDRSASLLALVAVVFVGMTGFGVFLPIFPFLALELNATPTTATLAMGAYSLGQVITSPLWGRLSDRIGRKPVLVLGLVGSVASYLWIAHASSVLELGAARLFGGLMAGNVGAAFAAAADLADGKTRARNMGLLGAAVGLGFIAGPALGGFLVGGEPDRAGFALACYVSAAMTCLAALAAWLLFRESLRIGDRAVRTVRASRWALLLERPTLARFAAIMLLAVGAQALMETTFGLWADARLAWGPREVAWTLAFMGAGAVLLQGGGAGAAARIWGERLTLLIGLALFAAGFCGLAVAREPLMLAIALAVLVCGIGLATPALNSLIAAQSDERDHGAVMGVSQSAAALGRVVGPLGAGALFDGFGPDAPFVVAALMIVAALFVALGEPLKDRAGAQLDSR